MARAGRSPSVQATMLTFLLSAAVFAACMRLGWILMDRLDGR